MDAFDLFLETLCVSKSFMLVSQLSLHKIWSSKTSVLFDTTMTSGRRSLYIKFTINDGLLITVWYLNRLT